MTVEQLAAQLRERGYSGEDDRKVISSAVFDLMEGLDAFAPEFPLSFIANATSVDDFLTTVKAHLFEFIDLKQAWRDWYLYELVPDLLSLGVSIDQLEASSRGRLSPEFCDSIFSDIRSLYGGKHGC